MSKKNLLKFAKRLLDALISVMGSLIPEGETKKAWLLGLEPTSKILDALSDSDPEDAKQVLEIVKDHTSKNVIPYTEERFLKLIERIPDKRWKDLVKVITVVPFGVARIYTDGNSMNSLQFNTFMEEWLENKTNQKILLDSGFGPLIEKLFSKNEWIGDLILNTLKDQLEDVNFDVNKDGK